MKVKNCEDCQKEFEYEPPANYPDKRKYCSACSAAKKAQWEAGDTIEVVKMAEKGSVKEFHLSPEQVEHNEREMRARALNLAMKWLPNVEGLSLSAILTAAEAIEEYLWNGK